MIINGGDVRVVIQRVSRASVTVDGTVVGRIGCGMVVLVGVTHGDTKADADHLAEKISGLRIFDDQQGKMNLSVGEVDGGLLLVSQFTLYGNIRRGRRPGFDAAASPQPARELYYYLVERCRILLPNVQTGVFRAKMTVSIENDGPVTFVHDTTPSRRSGAGT